MAEAENISSTTNVIARDNRLHNDNNSLSDLAPEISISAIIRTTELAVPAVPTKMRPEGVNSVGFKTVDIEPTSISPKSTKLLAITPARISPEVVDSKATQDEPTTVTESIVEDNIPASTATIDVVPMVSSEGMDSESSSPILTVAMENLPQVQSKPLQPITKATVTSENISKARADTAGLSNNLLLLTYQQACPPQLVNYMTQLQDKQTKRKRNKRKQNKRKFPFVVAPPPSSQAHPNAS